MRKLMVSEYLTLDGVMEDPGGHEIFRDDNWHFPFWGEEDVMQYKLEELLEADALLLGRRTYQEFAPVWPHVSDDTGFADRMNSLPKYVVSTTLQEVPWHNSRLLKGEVAEAVSKLKQQEGQAILLSGSGELARMLMESDLIDEYRLLVHPVVVGKGASFFKNITAKLTLKLVETKTFQKGIVLLCYQPA